MSAPAVSLAPLGSTRPRGSPARRCLPGLLASALLAAPAAGFEARVDEPAFTVLVPQLPAIDRLGDGAPGARWRGAAGGLEVDIESTPVTPDVSPRECARRVLTAILQRPGVPKRDEIWRAPLDGTTFLALYRSGDDGSPAARWHAHLISAVAGRCVEAHFARPPTAGEEDDAWRLRFDGARIEALSR